MRLAGLDPRPKLLFVVCVSTLAVLWREPAWLAGLLAVTVAVLLLGGVSTRRAWSQARGVVGVIAVLFVVQCVFVRTGEPVVSAGGVVLVTSGGLAVALGVTLRLLIVVCSALVLLTGEARDYLLALVQCRVPYEIAFMVMTALHFLPILREEALDVYHAVQMRGTEVARASLRARLAVYSRIALPIVAGALRRAEQVSLAMEARAFRALPHRTSLRRLTLATRDVVALVAVASATGGALVASVAA
jgi:energy-coupling factor transport system permease protein